MVATVSSLQSFPEPVTVCIQGASRGIGLAFVRELADDVNVDRIIATCRDPSRARDLGELSETTGDRIHLEHLDVTDEPSIASAAGRIGETIGKIDVLINCSGLLHDEAMGPERRLADVEPEAVMRGFAVNALGPLLVAKHFDRLFDSRRRAVLANISARVGSIGDNRLGGWYAYRVSKAAQNMVTRNLSIELRRSRRGIICVALHPGTVDTDLSRPFQKGVAEGKLFDVHRAVRQLLAVIDSLTPESNGRFYAWDGQEIPW